jgi:predicted ABC-type ATPase
VESFVKQPQLRMRIFAGPNGSGKSTVITDIKAKEENGRQIDFGYYINADDIAKALRNGRFSFLPYSIKPNALQLVTFARDSGLMADAKSLNDFASGFVIDGFKLFLLDIRLIDKVSQTIARFLRSQMLRLKRRFSFETVFSHESNLDIMREATDAGYKVYLYFVSTDSPDINKYRVALRVTQGGHSVPEDKIESRYFRSMALLNEAVDLSYQVFCFDNSNDGMPFRLTAHGKRKSGIMEWDEIPEEDQTHWFKKYCNQSSANQ